MKLQLVFALGLLCAITPGALAQEKNPKVLIKTSKGNITVELDKAKAPITTANFLSYVDDKFYDGTIFHRVIPTFMIQGGGIEKGLQDAKTVEDFQKGTKKTKPPIKNESGNGLSNSRGSIAMARTNDLHSATSQFFINVVDNDRLDGAKYCVFGKVVEGLDVVDKIRNVETRSIQGEIGDVPVQDVVILSVSKIP